MAEQVRFGGLRNMFHVIDFAVAQSFEHELAVVFEGDPIHRLSSSPVADRSRRRVRAWSPTASERMRVRPASLQESTIAAWSPPSGLAQWQVGLPQRVLRP